MSDEQNSATARIKARSLAIMWVGADQEEAFVDDIAGALLAAEQRGREMEREECAQFVTSCGARFGIQSQNPTRSESVADICHIFDGYLRGVAALIRLRSKLGKGE